MTPNYKDKLRRAALIHLDLLEKEKTHGYSAPSPFAEHRKNLRIIKDGTWQARIIEDAFMTNASLGKDRYGEAILPAPGWSVIEIFIQGRRRLAFSIREGDIHMHRYEPGLWENWFGVDNGGDTAPVNCELFAADNDPRWRAFMASGLSQWPPKFDAGEFIRPAQ